VTGAVVSDRWLWTQWAAWIPAVLLLPGGLLLWLGWRLLRRRVRWLGIVIAAAGPVIYVSALWKPAGGPPPSGTSVLHWTAGPIRGTPEPYAAFIMSQDADVAIVEGARRAGTDPMFRTWSADHHVAVRGPFLIASRLPIRTLRTIAWAEDILLFLLVVERPDGSPLRMLVVDLPSDPGRSRRGVIDTAHELLGQLDEPVDLIIGDFNLTRCSSQLRRFKPGFAPMWGAHGSGWGGTYPRAFPVTRLDHVLAADPTLIESISTSTPPVGRHRAQRITVSGCP
jgi:endonuclease/exonuclease/phosphatase family metal-dependent hydrolase